MHIPDGVVDPAVSVAAGVVAVGAVAMAVRAARKDVDEASVPIAGLTAVFVFAAQMINVPVAAGTSGHLIGAVLASILIGPFAAMLAMTVVLCVQALVFADGGLSALGLNIVNMGVIAVIVGWAVFRLMSRVTRGRASLVPLAAGMAGFVGAMAAVSGFVVEYALGGVAPIPIHTVALAMLGTHVPIALIEGVITGLVVASVAKVRPDLVRGLRGVSATDRTAGAGVPAQRRDVRGSVPGPESVADAVNRTDAGPGTR